LFTFFDLIILQTIASSPDLNIAIIESSNKSLESVPISFTRKRCFHWRWRWRR